MKTKLKIGVIGAGSISISHLESYQKNPDVEVCIICDVVEDNARARAEEFNIPAYCTDAKQILDDASIDAVSIVTPTFTHKDMVLAALASGKHVLCEKPPALNAEEAAQCEAAAKAANKLLMYGFVCRFTKEVAFLKEYVDSGAMGQIYYAEASRLFRCFNIGGWFINKEKSGGGALIDSAIHELDAVLYLMGYPKVHSVKGFSYDINSNLPGTMKGTGSNWKSSDPQHNQRSVESFAGGLVRFENGASLYVKASMVLNTVKEGRHFELSGTKSGASFDTDGLKLLSFSDTGYYLESSPVLRNNVDLFACEINHFVDCCLGKAECICKPHHGTQIMQIIEGIYKSAETGQEIVF